VLGRIRVDRLAGSLSLAIQGQSPHPRHRDTEIVYTVGRSTPVRLDAYDVSGRLCASLVRQTCAAGRYAATWRLGDTSAGVYFIRLETLEGRRVARTVVAE
jgi:hypothetical protein